MKIGSFINLFVDSDDSFEGQEKGEDVVMLLRRHVYVIYTQLIVFFFALLIPIIIGEVFKTFISAKNLFEVFIFLCSLWYMFAWLMIFYALAMYSLNVVIVTNFRLIDSNQKGFFNRRISEVHLSRIQDITVHTEGFIQTVFKFGSIELQTASEEREFIFPQIPNPEHVKDVIMNLAEECVKNQNHQPV